MAVLSAGPAAGAAVPAVQFYDGSFECYAGPLALHLPDTYPQLLRLGRVRGTRDMQAQTGHGLTTTERYVEFRGLALTVYLFSGDPGRYQVVSVHISGAGWRRLSALRVGQGVNTVSLPRGWPVLPRRGTWEVQGDSARLLVTVRRGRVAALDYLCDTGH